MPASPAVMTSTTPHVEQQQPLEFAEGGVEIAHRVERLLWEHPVAAADATGERVELRRPIGTPTDRSVSGMLSRPKNQPARGLLLSGCLAGR